MSSEKLHHGHLRLLKSRSVSWKAPQKGSFTIRITADDGTNKAIRTINIKVK